MPGAVRGSQESLTISRALQSLPSMSVPDKYTLELLETYNFSRLMRYVQDSIMLCTEYCENGSLYDQLAEQECKHADGPLCWYRRWPLVRLANAAGMG